MCRTVGTLLLVLLTTGTAFASGSHDHTIPTLKDQPKTTVSVEGNTVTLTFGPIDLPAGHTGDLAASMPKHVFQIPEDMYLVAFKSAIFTKEGTPLPQQYLHHILLINLYRDPRVPMICVTWSFLVAFFLFLGAPASASDPTGPEEVIRTLVQANVDKDLDTMSRLMAHDADSVNYSIGGRKYEGWADFAREMRREFASVSRLEIPIKELKLWTRDDTAWFAMEIDYIRYVGEGDQERRTVIPLRETGVLERRDGTWVLVTWHESFAGKGVGFSGVNSTSFSSLPLRQNRPCPLNARI